MIVAGALLLGAVIGVSLGALGGGGSILTVPALVYALGEHARAATTGSLVIVGITSIVGAVGHARSGNVRWRAGLVFGAVGVGASYAGAALNRQVNSNVLLLAFAALMLVAAAAMLRRSRVPTPRPAAGRATRRQLALSGGGGGGGTAVAEPEPAAPDPAHPAGRPAAAAAAKLLAAGLAVGFLTGFLGVGGGFVIVPALVVALDFAMPEAVATSLLVIAINCAAALGARAGHETFHWALIIPFTAAAVVTSLAGGPIARRVSSRSLTRAFAVLLVAVAGYTAIRSGLALG